VPIALLSFHSLEGSGVGIPTRQTSSLFRIILLSFFLFALHSNQTLISPAHLFWLTTLFYWIFLFFLLSSCLAWLCLLSFPTTIHPGSARSSRPLAQSLSKPWG